MITDIRETRRLEALQWELEQTLAPVVKAKRDIINFSPPQILIHSDGHVERIYSKEVQKQMAEADRLIEKLTEIFCNKHKLELPYSEGASKG